MMNLLSIFVMMASISVPTEDECLHLQTAHSTLLGSTFTTIRHFTLKLNGELKMREVTHLTYADGKLTKVLLEKEVFDDSLVLEEGAGDAMLELPFDCSRVELVDEATVQLHNPDRTENVTFAWNSVEGTLQPSLWENNETERFLWRKFVISAVAEYKDFSRE